MKRIHALAVLAVLTVLACFLPPALADDDHDRDRQDDRDKHKGDFEIRTLSNRADLISGGDALVEISVPRGVQLDQVRVRLEGRDVTAAFKPGAAARTLRGVVTGMGKGRNDLVVDTKTKGHGHAQPWAKLVITNHPIGGPVLLGSQTQPWICATPTPVPASGNTPASNASGLSTFATDAQCNIATEYKLFYRTTASPCSTALPDPSPPATPPANACFKPYTVGTTPADLATTTPTHMTTAVPYIVRVERGTINRGIYDIAVLFDPAKPWTALVPQPQWNGKVVYTFGASTGQPRLQFRTEQNWADDNALSRGFMVVDNSLTDSLYNSNRVLNTETLMMMKEHIVDSYGEIAFLMGNGCSGGSIQQNTAASIYPGLLDGIQPSCDYPDSITTGLEVTDCVLLVNFYDSLEWKALMAGKSQSAINEKKAAINGHLNQLGCQSWNNAFGFNGKPGNYVRLLVLDQNTGAMGVIPGEQPRNNCLLPAALVYDATKNPDGTLKNPNGTRCGDADLSTAVWGTTTNENAPGSVRARQTLDNVGIQYGLGALLRGLADPKNTRSITAEEFVTLNEKIGGFDADVNRRPARTAADREALDIAYRAGIVSSGAHLGQLAIIDSRGWDEQGIHYIFRSFAERARIEADNHGNHGNQVMWRYGTGLLPGTAAQVAAVTVPSLLTMDKWLTDLNVSAPKETLNSPRTQAQVIAGKPVGPVAPGQPITATDTCFLAADPTFTTPVTDMAVCDADAPISPPQGDGLGRMAKRASPRQVAGGPLAENILKCRRKPLSRLDYPTDTFTAAQWARLQAAFPDGVCDWRRPGVGQQPAVSPLTFAHGPGGRRLPPAPRSDDDRDDD